MKPFAFTDNVPLGIQAIVRDEIQVWIDREDCPVVGIVLPNGTEVDFCRRPWPPEQGMLTAVGAEHESDEQRIKDFLHLKG